MRLGGHRQLNLQDDELQLQTSMIRNIFEWRSAALFVVCAAMISDLSALQCEVGRPLGAQFVGSLVAAGKVNSKILGEVLLLVSGRPATVEDVYTMGC